MLMKNRHSKSMCNGIHKLKENLRSKIFEVQYTNGWCCLKEVKQ